MIARIGRIEARLGLKSVNLKMRGRKLKSGIRNPEAVRSESGNGAWRPESRESGIWWPGPLGLTLEAEVMRLRISTCHNAQCKVAGKLNGVMKFMKP